MANIPTISQESAVKQRYSSAAQVPEPALCCPIRYDPKYLAIIPKEVIEKDYGCGDPSQYLKPGETVLDLGSGTGKICFIAAQVVGPQGRVIGVDMTDEMLEVARRNAPIVAERLGYANVEFRKGRIQDLSLDLEALDADLRKAPIADANAFVRAGELAEELRRQRPLIATDSVDVVVSNCVLNLVASSAKRQLFQEIFRVLKIGGRAVISDIVSDAEIPAELQADQTLWSGCLSGALRGDLFMRAFEEAGFQGIRLLQRAEEPWQKVHGIDFRSVTIEAFKFNPRIDGESTRSIIYKGPFREVWSDDGLRFRRGEPVAVGLSTAEHYGEVPYAEHFAFAEPRTKSHPGEAARRDLDGTNAVKGNGTKGIAFIRAPKTGSCCCAGDGC